MTEKGNQTEHTSFADRYEQAKKEKPHLAKLIDGVQYENFPSVETTADPSSSEHFQRLFTRERLRFLELCTKDVELNETQAKVVEEVLSRTIVGFGIKEYLVGDDLIAEKHPESLLAAAAYINSL
ncbi:MAG TPA: hypothetical protein VMX76_02830 [Nevskiaceae bacterium]|nr:hypothetical protein [Nevskiaceae bacterium]